MARPPLRPSARRSPRRSPPRSALPVVLVLQGGGALGAYQVGVYEAMRAAGLEPDWVIGTSIGAINGALIAGNRPCDRMDRLERFWDGVERADVDFGGRLWEALGGVLPGGLGALGGVGNAGALADPFTAVGWTPWLRNAGVVGGGIPSFFAPNPIAALVPRSPVGIARAAYYDTAPLRRTLVSLVDFAHLGGRQVRLTVGAVSALSGAMRYFDSREQVLGVDHVMASGALPPAFPAVRIGDDWFWDGGIYSNTPIEAVLDDHPRRSALIFSVNVWQPDGPAPDSLWQVLGRSKEIQYASRGDSHIERQRQLHRLRHVIRQIEAHLPPSVRDDPEVRELCDWGCGTTMHVVRLTAPRLPGEDHTKDIDFSSAGLAARRRAGRAAAEGVIARAPWRTPVDPIEGVVLHPAA